jgi:NTE family protein
VIDTAAEPVRAEHICASAALLATYPAVEVDGRLLADGGLAMNAPLEPFLASDRQDADWPLAVLVDLFSPSSARPQTLKAAAARGTDLQFAMQTVMRLRAIARERALEARLASDGATDTTVYHLRYRPPANEASSEKPYDFSASRLRQRMADGERDAERMLTLAAAPATGRSGFAVVEVGEA